MYGVFLLMFKYGKRVVQIEKLTEGVANLQYFDCAVKYKYSDKDLWFLTLCTVCMYV